MKNRIIRTVFAVLCGAVICTANAYASDRNFIISKISTEYFCNDIGAVIDDIQKTDITLPDDEYFKKVFSYLDSYSRYYTESEYKSSVISDSGKMIAAQIYKDEINIKIDHFGKGVEDIFAEYIRTSKESGIKKLTLDLSECPGGYVDVMNKIACEILPKGKILTAKFRDSEKVYSSDLEKCPFDEIDVIISSKTASAAEILAAGLQESGAAEIIGTNSYGKTSIQSFYRLENGGAFKITCGKYLTRAGKDITGTGVTPGRIRYDMPVMIRWSEQCKNILGTRK